MLDKSLDKSFNSSFGQEHIISEETSETEEGIIINDDGGDSLSGDSDDTSYSTWKRPPPPDKRVHRYLDEMRVSGDVFAEYYILNVTLHAKRGLMDFTKKTVNFFSRSWCVNLSFQAVNSKFHA